MTEAADLTGARRHAQIEGYPDPGLGLRERVGGMTEVFYTVLVAATVLRLAKKEAEAQS